MLRLARARPNLPSSTQPAGASPARLGGCCENERPEHLVFGFGGVDRGNAHAGCSIQQHVGAMRRRIPPAGKSLCEGVIAGADVLRCRPGAVAVRLEPLAEVVADIVVE